MKTKTQKEKYNPNWDLRSIPDNVLLEELTKHRTHLAAWAMNRKRKNPYRPPILTDGTPEQLEKRRKAREAMEKYRKRLAAGEVNRRVA